jgi:5-methylcytosine-specific restriction endonuclease McrA
MKKVDDIPLDVLIADYAELKSAYKVAAKHNVSATAVKRILKVERVLRTQSIAAKQRDAVTNRGKYERTPEVRQRISEAAKKRTDGRNKGKKLNITDEQRKAISERFKRQTGKRNPNYKDGNYQRRPRDYKIHEFVKVRNFVFNRDDYTCHYCKGIGGHLHGHHKLPYWVDKEAFLDPNNIVTVCTKCHFDKAHKGNWQKFDAELIDERLLKKYKLDRERLNDLADNKEILSDAIVQTGDINKTPEVSRNDLPLLKKEE